MRNGLNLVGAESRGGNLSGNGLESPQFLVLGLGLNGVSGSRLREAYPGSFCHDPCEERQAETVAMCHELAGPAVVFLGVGEDHAYLRVRVSTMFDQQMVKVVGVYPRCVATQYDEALQLEMSGALEAGSSAGMYRRAADSVNAGELWFPRGYLSRRLLAAVAEDSPGTLSGREGEILELLGAGSTNQTIAERLFVSRETVRWHLRSIYGKLGVSSREAARRYARNWVQQRDLAAG